MGRIKDTSTLKSFNNRSFGVEIEFVLKRGISTELAAAKIEEYANNRLPQDNQLTVRFAGYTHAVTQCWKIVTDASVHSTQATRGYHKGLELVSPIIKGEKGAQQLKVILEAMKQDFNGKALCAINRTCGLHVHHDIRVWRDELRSQDVLSNENAINKLTNLITLTTKFEDVIYGMLPRSRRQGSWCQPVSNIYNNVFSAINGKSNHKRSAKVKYLKNVKKNNGNSTRWQIGRYCGLNTQNFFKYGAVEFRYGSPTLNFEKMINWVVFTQCFVNMAETFKTVNSVKEMKLDTKKNVDLTFEKMRDSLGLTKRMCRDDFQRNCSLWIRKRFNHFNPTTA